MIEIKKFTFNPIQENTYVVFDHTGECVIIDAGCYFEEEQQELSSFIAEKKLKPVLLVNTHCHFDHMLGVNYCRYQYKIPFFIPEGEQALLEWAVGQGDMFGIPTEPLDAADGTLQEGQLIQFGESSLEVIAAPGHSPGGLVFYQAEQKWLIAGDVIFYGSIGRTDLPGGSFQQLTDNIRKKLLILPTDTKIFCGHGPETTIGFEKENNPFLMD